MMELRGESRDAEIVSTTPTWLQKRTRLERRLIIVVNVVIGVIVSFLIESAFYSYKDSAEACKTLECITASSDVLNRLDETTNPCDNFFKFACGKLSERTNEKDFPGEFARHEIKKRLSNILFEPTNAKDSAALNFEKHMFRACTKEASDGKSLYVLKKILTKVGGWPVLLGDKWIAEKFDWIELTRKLRDIGLHHKILLKVDVKDNSELFGRNITLRGGDLFLNINRFVYLHEKLMVDDAISFGAKESRAVEEMNKSFDFMIKLREVSSYEDRKSKVGERRLQISELQKDCEQINWLKYLNVKLEPALSLTEQDYVLVPYSNFSNNFCNLMNTTDQRTLANYMLWSAISRVLPVVSEELLEVRNKFRCVTSSSVQDLEDECLDAISFTTNQLSSYLIYVNRHVSNSAREKVRRMFDSLVNQLKKIIVANSWIGEDSKSKAYEWLEKLIPIVGSKPEIINDVYDKNYVINDNDSFLEIYLRRKKEIALRVLYGNITWDTMHHQIPETRIFFFERENAIMLPTSTLQGIYFDENRPMYMNYGTLGAYIGSVLAFTYTFSHMNELWPENLEMFKKKAKCVRHKSDYFNEESTWNFPNYYKYAQILGTQLAYDAYKSWTKENGNELNLIGTNYTNLQLFWISHLANFCYEETYNTALNFYSDSETVKQNFDFAIDFRCELNSKMNPSNKCIIL